MSDHTVQLPEGMTADDARDVLREYARTDDAQITDNDTLAALREEVKEAKEAFAAVLAEESPQSADTLARQDMDALTEPFRDDEGDINVDTLRQEPETKSGAGGSGGDDPSDDPDPDTLSLDDKEELQRLDRKRRTFRSRGIDGRADTLEAEMCELAGIKDFDTLETEVL